METTRLYLLHNSNDHHRHLSLYPHLHRACLLGRHLPKLDMAVPKDSYRQDLILLNSKLSLLPVPHHLLDLVHRLDLAHLQAKVLRRECHRDFSHQGLVGPGSIGTIRFTT